MCQPTRQNEDITIGVLALQGAFEEHQRCLEAVGCKTLQVCTKISQFWACFRSAGLGSPNSLRKVRTPDQLQGLDGIVLPGGESTAMGLIGTSTSMGKDVNMWDSLRQFSKEKPVWGTCAGMILLAEKCIGTSAVIENGQSLIGGVDITVCRNYFGSQISSFEMATPPPPNVQPEQASSFPGIFIRAPAILSAGADVEVLGKVVATPCRHAAVTLEELERKVAVGENVVKMGVVDALERGSNKLQYKVVMRGQDEVPAVSSSSTISLPGAAPGSTAREVICAVRKRNILCTAFHPELTDDYRWHRYFASMVASTSTRST